MKLESERIQKTDQLRVSRIDKELKQHINKDHRLIRPKNDIYLTFISFLLLRVHPETIYKALL